LVQKFGLVQQYIFTNFPYHSSLSTGTLPEIILKTGLKQVKLVGLYWILLK